MAYENTLVHFEQGGATLDVESGGALNVKSGGALQIAGTAVTASATELNALTSQGMVAADAAKLHAITSTAVELSLTHNSVAGSAIASAAAVLGANKNLDMLAIADGGLALGAGAGTAVTSTAAELNILHSQAATAADIAKLHAVTASAADLNVVLSAAAMSTDGLWRRGTARFTFDPSGTPALRTVAPHGTGVTLPQYAIVVGGVVEVNTAFTSAGANDGTVAIMVQGAGDIIVAAPVSGAPYSTIGLKAIVPKNNTPELGIKCTAAHEITVTVAVDALTAGKLTGFLDYYVSAASA